MIIEKYYLLDPDQGTYFVYMSDLTDAQFQYIKDNIDDTIEEEIEEDEGYITKYSVEVACYKSNQFDDLITYLKKEGFVNVSSHKYI